VFSGYGLLLGASEGIASAPLTIRFSAAEGGRLRTAMRDSVGCTLAIGLASGAVCVLVAPLFGSRTADLLRALGVGLPGLLVQDGWRYAFTAARRPAMAAANDGAWAVLQIVGTVVVISRGQESAAGLVLVWGAAATAAAVLGCLQAKALPALFGTVRWFRAHRDLATRYALENVVHRGGPYLWLFAIGAVAGLETVAGVRGAMLLLSGPLNPLIIGASFAAVPEGVRLFQEDPNRLPGAVRLLSAAVATAAIAWCVVAIAISGPLGPQLLGSTWRFARPLLPVLAVNVVLLTTSIGPSQGLWVLAAASRSLGIQLVSVCLGLVLITAGAAVAAGQGAAVGTLAATAVITYFFWRQFGLAFAEATAGQLDASHAATAPPQTGL
jgi:O-antigen/teichoic acid export membrane protein